MTLILERAYFLIKFCSKIKTFSLEFFLKSWYPRKLIPGLIGVATAFEFEPLTPQLPADLPPVFDCVGGSRIVGGGFSDNPWSFFVQLRSWKNSNQAQNRPDEFDQCGGVIIHDRWILISVTKSILPQNLNPKTKP